MKLLPYPLQWHVPHTLKVNNPNQPALGVNENVPWSQIAVVMLEDELRTIHLHILAVLKERMQVELPLCVVIFCEVQFGKMSPINTSYSIPLLCRQIHAETSNALSAIALGISIHVMPTEHAVRLAFSAQSGLLC